MRRKRQRTAAKPQVPERSFQWKHWAFFVFVLVVVAGLTYVIAGLLSAVNHKYIAWVGQRGETLLPARSEWVALGGLIAFAAMVCGLPRALARLFGYPIDSWSSVLLAAYQVGLVCIVGVALLDTRKYTVFAAGALIEQRALGWSADHYSCADIRDVTMSHYFIPAGRYGSDRISDARALYVWFNDGSHWSPHRSSFVLTAERSVRLGEQLARDCGFTLRYPHDVADRPDSVPPEKYTRRLLDVAAVTIAAAVAVWLRRRQIKGSGLLRAHRVR